jgi:hypothetical protein
MYISNGSLTTTVSLKYTVSYTYFTASQACLGLELDPFGPLYDT